MNKEDPIRLEINLCTDNYSQTIAFYEDYWKMMVDRRFLIEKIISELDALIEKQKERDMKEREKKSFTQSDG
jgi:hypothetical protein